MTYVLSDFIFLRTPQLLMNSTYKFLYFLLHPIHVVVHRHEDDSIFDLFNSDFPKHLQCCVSWENFHSSTTGSRSKPSIHETSRIFMRLREPLNFLPRRVYWSWIFKNSAKTKFRIHKSGNHAKRVQVRYALWMMRAVFVIRLGPKTSVDHKNVSVMSTVPGCDVTNCATTLQGFNKHASSRREAVSDSRGVPRCTEKIS